MNKARIPQCITPRPGEKVIAYAESLRLEGTFIGYNVDDGLIIHTEFNHETVIYDHIKVRPKDPFSRHKPNWWKYYKNGHAYQATSEQIAEFERILNAKIPPGPSYMEFIHEVWARGYEIYLVGGTVRDVICGYKANDVDLVTTMPFNLLILLVESMYGDENYNRQTLDGFLTVAINEKLDPNIDVKSFFIFAPGTKIAKFGSDLTIDCKVRDFSFNAIYYDPINKFYIDPTGRGIRDAKEKEIFIIKDPNFNHPIINSAGILIRFFKFLYKGYKYTDQALKEIRETYVPNFAGMGHTRRIAALKSQIIKHQKDEEFETVIERLKEIMKTCDCFQAWVSYYERHVDELRD